MDHGCNSEYRAWTLWALRFERFCSGGEHERTAVFFLTSDHTTVFFWLRKALVVEDKDYLLIPIGRSSCRCIGLATSWKLVRHMVWTIFDVGHSPRSPWNIFQWLHYSQENQRFEEAHCLWYEYLPDFNMEDSPWSESPGDWLWYKRLSITVFLHVEPWCILHFNAQKQCWFWMGVCLRVVSELLVR